MALLKSIYGQMTIRYINRHFNLTIPYTPSFQYFLSTMARSNTLFIVALCLIIAVAKITGQCNPLCAQYSGYGCCPNDNLYVLLSIKLSSLLW